MWANERACKHSHFSTKNETKTRGGKPQRTRPRAPRGPSSASHRAPTPRTPLPWPPPSRPATPARTCGVEARANRFYKAYTCAHGPPTPYLAIRAPQLAPTCTCSCARAPRAPPALRPVLPGTRPRKRRRGPCGPEVEKSSPPAPSGRSRCRYLPRRALQAWLHRHRAIRRRSASRNRPVAACGSNILARGKG